MTLEEQIAAVRREIGMRERVYPRWVESGKMTQKKADHEKAAMAAVLATLLEIEDKRRRETELFPMTFSHTEPHNA